MKIELDLTINQYLTLKTAIMEGLANAQLRAEVAGRQHNTGSLEQTTRYNDYRENVSALQDILGKYLRAE